MPAVDQPRVGAFALPFYPMRPKHGPVLRRVEQVAALRATHHVQPKLNGDRACLAAIGGRLYIQNRHGSFFKQSVDLTPWEALAQSARGDTLLDGEVIGKGFFPFEVIIAEGQDLSAACPSTRAVAARAACLKFNVEWLFEPPTDAWLAEQLAQKRDIKRRWEGVVAKRLKSAYVPSGTESGESDKWFKLKWP